MGNTLSVCVSLALMARKSVALDGCNTTPLALNSICSGAECGGVMTCTDSTVIGRETCTVSRCGGGGFACSGHNVSSPLWKLHAQSRAKPSGICRSSRFAIGRMRFTPAGDHRNQRPSSCRRCAPQCGHHRTVGASSRIVGCLQLPYMFAIVARMLRRCKCTALLIDNGHRMHFRARDGFVELCMRIPQPGDITFCGGCARLYRVVSVNGNVRRARWVDVPAAILAPVRSYRRRLLLSIHEAQP